MRKKEFHKNRGFTLLEVIISIAISSLLLLTLYFTFFSINRSIDSATEGQEALETGRVLMELIKQDLRGISPNPKHRFIGKIPNKEEKEPDSRIDFVTTSYMGSNPFGMSEVGYFIYVTDDNKKILVRRESKEVKDNPDEGGQNFELSRIVKSFKVSFYNGTEWLEEWDSRTQGRLPNQVRITIIVMDEKGKTKEFTTDETIPGTL
ncbi:MAG: prepilin-type N-terminal cleavage/methylation domain-containing protein [Syntrophorhabdaceae bacterium]|nr:prepilin-type N-terminal cleavage/methylation domain-containing protein [Syntrophorhabdaceae bacterium]